MTGQRAYKGQAAHRGKRVSTADLKRLWEDKTLSMTDIGKRLDISLQAVVARAKRRGLGPRPLQGQRVRASVTKLAQDPLFPKLWAQGASREALRAYYGVGSSQITEAVRELGLPKRAQSRWNRRTLEETLVLIRTEDSRKAWAAAQLRLQQDFDPETGTWSRLNKRWEQGALR